MPCENSCKYDQEIMLIKRKVEDLEKDAERNQATHKDFFARFEQQREKNAITEERYAAILASITKIEKDVEEIKKAPAKRWDIIINSAVQWVVVAVLAAIVVFQ